MKKPILLSFILFVPIALFGQSFTFHSDTLNFQGQPGDLFDHYVDIQNISAQNLNISIIRTQNNLPDSQWTSSICTAELCFPSDIDTVDYASIIGPLQPDSTIDFHLQVFSNPSTSGTGVVTIKVENQANPSDTAALTFTFSTQQTEIKRDPQNLSGTFQLFANYPNPFNPETRISFVLPDIGEAKQANLSIYNQVGQKVITLMNESKHSGKYEVVWDGRNSKGNQVASGIYFYHLEYERYAATHKMILMR